MCYEWGETGAYHAKSNPAMLDLPVVLRTVEECLPVKPLFEFFGGEPLLYPGIWDVISLIRKGGCDLAFSTNGTLLEDHAERLTQTAPTRLWISLDGPEAINDGQRGHSVFQRAVAGMERLDSLKRAKGNHFPELGVTYVVTPSNYRHIEEFFMRCLDISMLACVSIELQSYATAEQSEQYARELMTEFGVASTPCAAAYVRNPAVFASIDFDCLTRQMVGVRDFCVKHDIVFYSQPKTLEVDNIRNFFTANWKAMTDKKSRCAVPWISAEISARGDVTTCHTFYDLSVGNIYEKPLTEIWRGAQLKRLQAHLRTKLFPICTACCRYYLCE
jgi:radical SAM protein with 4Fe4S-binding SPASM domain